jgi:hypothetical protein
MNLWHPAALQSLPPATVSAPDQLTKLNLSGTGLTDAGLRALASRNRGLLELDISKTNTLLCKEAPASLGELTHVKKLNIANTGVNNALFRAIWAAGKFPALASLDISGTLVTDKGLVTEPPNLAIGFTSVKELFCADTRVTAAGVNRRNALLNAPSCPEFGLAARAARPTPEERVEMERKDRRMP